MLCPYDDILGTPMTRIILDFRRPSVEIFYLSLAKILTICIICMLLDDVNAKTL